MSKRLSDPKPSIVFFGAGPVAAKSLELLLPNFRVEAVITKPKAKRNSAPVIELAEPHKLPTFTVLNRIELSELLKNSSFSSQIGLVIDFGVIISKDVIESFKKGIVNSHFSLLPEWRGADPITFALLSGQSETGVSLMSIDEKLDEGPVIVQKSLQISDQHTNQSLTADLIDLSNKLLAEYLPQYLDGRVSHIPQDILRQQNHLKISYSRKLSKEDGLINWNLSASQIERQIRAFLGWPQSRCKLNNLELIITKARVSTQKIKPGEYVIENSSLIVGCKDGSLAIEQLKPIGKTEMNIKAFLAGYRDRL